jgi:hypothetical protein
MAGIADSVSEDYGILDYLPAVSPLVPLVRLANSRYQSASFFSLFSSRRVRFG